MELIITEKPSVGRAIAAALGITERHKGYMLGKGCVVSWCIGHLVEPAMPDVYDERYKRWRYSDLPIIPREWHYVVSENTSSQFSVLKQLMHDNRMTGIICATDAGREGELIFRLVYQQAKCTLPVRRLWISSMEESAIREGFHHLKDAKEYDNLYQAALCRAKADWLIGMNATRLYSLLYGPTLHIGRVMSPTLAMVVKREEAVTTFQSEPFFTVNLDFPGFTAHSERFADKESAERLCAACSQNEVRISHIEHKRKETKPPQLYDLTTLQRDANRLFGFTAQQTLEYAQSLYEKSLITYPRTDSRYLSDEMNGHLSELVEQTASTLPAIKDLSLPIHKENVINSSKVTDHHAIIPTASIQSQIADDRNITTGERDLLQMVCVRLICAVGDSCLTDEMTLTLTCSNQAFTANGKHVVQPGWQAAWYGFRSSLTGRLVEDLQKQTNELPTDISDGMLLHPANIRVAEGKTMPPNRFTEGDVLHAMESAGAKEMPDDAEHKGIGTPATRAAILEKLLSAGLLERKGDKKKKVLVPTAKGTALSSVLPEQLLSPALTANWENRLKQIERGEDDPNRFLQDIEAMITEFTKTVHRVDNADALFPCPREKVAVCPKCGAAITERSLGFLCENRTCGFVLWKAQEFLKPSGRILTADMVQELLGKGSLHLTKLRSAKAHTTFDANVTLGYNKNGKPILHLSIL